MSKPKLAFIGHSFHKKTLSHLFLCEILRREFEVEIFWDESWAGGLRVDIGRLADGYENFLFFQTMYGRAEVGAILRKNVTFVPMYDGVWRETPRYWRKCRTFKIVSFCHAIHREMQRLGLASYYIQYYPPVEKPEINRDHKKPVIYFWQRVGEITWRQIRGLFDPDDIGKVIINRSVDPGEEFVMPDAEAMERYGIELVSWFERKEDYLRLLGEVDIVVAPRLREGIGFSFLNAMARGKVIVAANLPTANEYIDGENGYLFEPGRIERLVVSDFIGKSEVSYRRYREGLERSRAAEEGMLEFVKRKGSPAGRAWAVNLRSVLGMAGWR